MPKSLYALAAIIVALAGHADTATRVVAGPLTITLHISETAHVFHLVDQLAAWSPYCHGQYAAHFSNLTAEDRALLAEHAALRRLKPWGEGLEQTFYTDVPLEKAIEAGIAAEHLTEDQAEVERRVLTGFAPRANALMNAHAKTLVAFAKALQDEQEEIASMARQAGRLCRIEAIEAPAYAIASPDVNAFGGGFNGGRLAIEVSSSPEVMNVFLHEVLHVFLRARDDAIVSAAAADPTLDRETLAEGIAYALSPGLLHAHGPDADPLASRVAADWQAGNPLDDPYVRFNRFGLAVRPLLKQALDDDSATLDAFLPRVVDAWRVMSELSAATGGGSAKWEGKKSPGPSVLILAPDMCGAFHVLAQRVQGQGRNIWGRNHEPQFYEEMHTLHVKPGDIAILAFTLDQPERIPDQYAFLLPRPWTALENELAPGNLVSESHEVEQVHVTVVLAATCDELTTALENLDLRLER